MTRLSALFGALVLFVQVQAQCTELDVELFSVAPVESVSRLRPLTHHPEQTVFLELQGEAMRQVREVKPTQLTTVFPGPNGAKWGLEWERFSA